MSAHINSLQAGYGINNLFALIFEPTSDAAIGDPMSNSFLIGNCGDDPFYIDGIMNGGYGGIITITPP